MQTEKVVNLDQITEWRQKRMPIPVSVYPIPLHVAAAQINKDQLEIEN